jgi:hypothetical protein
MYTLKFTTKQLQVLNNMLIEQSYKIVAPIIDSINKQIKEQEKIGEE